MKIILLTISFGLLNLYTILPAFSAPQKRDCDFILERPLDFVGETIDSCVSRAHIERLMNRKVEIGSSEDDAYEFLQLGTSRVRVETCNEFFAAIRQGAYSSGSRSDIAMGSSFVHTCGILSALQSAEKAKKSFLPDGKLKQKDEHWPIQWAARRALVDITGNDLGAYWENWQEWWNKKN